MEPAFAWWVHHTLKKRNRIIVIVKSKYWLKAHKFRIKVPKNVKQEIYFDCDNGNTMWLDYVSHEIKNIHHAFEPWEKP